MAANNDLPALDRNQLSYFQRWRAAIDVQMHFNDMLMRTRTIGLSTVIAVYGAAILSATRAPDRAIGVIGLQVHAGVGIFACGVILLLGLFILDRAYYYRMLMAAVDYAQSLERESGADTQPVQLGMTTHISTHVSRRSAEAVLWLFYLLPLLAGLLLLVAAYMT